MAADWDLGNYPDGWVALEQPFGVYLVNSFVIVTLSIVGNLVSCSLAAYGPLLVPNFLATNAFYIFLMVQFMRALPRELDDAARIDGCGPFRTFWSVIMPLCLPAFATTAIFTFISVWNEFFGPLIYLTDSELYTVPLALRQFVDSEGQSQWGQMFAMSFLSLAPVIGFFIAGQKYLVKGIATTGLK